MLSSTHHDHPLAACATNDAARTFASSFIVRAVQEECTLIREPPGYSDYGSARSSSTHPAHLVNRLKSCHRLFPATPECRKCRSNDSTVQRFYLAKPARATERFARSADRRGVSPLGGKSQFPISWSLWNFGGDLQLL